jgi:thioredoxin-related protein
MINLAQNIFTILLVVAHIGCSESKVKNTISLESKFLPSFDFLLMDSVTKYNTSNTPFGNQTILFYFNPNCPYCIAQTKDLISMSKSNPNLNFYFLSNYPFNKTKEYYLRYKLYSLKNIIVGRDYKLSFAKYYNITEVPYTVLYDGNKTLIKIFRGYIQSTTIKNIIPK